jgi:MFS family permease
LIFSSLDLLTLPPPPPLPAGRPPPPPRPCPPPPPPVRPPRRGAAAAPARGDAPAPTDESSPAATRRAVVLAGGVMVLTQLVMVAIMTMTPIHMTHHGHAVATAGAVIAVHVAMMYLPSPLSGWLTDRFGPVTVAVAAGATLLAAGLVAGLAPASSVVWLAVGLGLLGLGWSLGLVSGTAMLTAAVPLAQRARTQGSVDLAVALAGAAGGLGSGFVVASSSYTALAIGGGLLGLAVLPVVALSLRRA